MLPETLLVPTNNYLAFMSGRSTRDELHIAAQRLIRARAYARANPTASLLLYPPREHPRWAGEHIGVHAVSDGPDVTRAGLQDE